LELLQLLVGGFKLPAKLWDTAKTKLRRAGEVALALGVGLFGPGCLDLFLDRADARDGFLLFLPMRGQ